jgi:protein gp37
MGIKTIIGWTERTWNVWIGCDKISPGCANCYMFTWQYRYGMDPTKVRKTKTWRDPFKWQREAERDGRRYRVFTCSLSDFFHPGADAWRPEAWSIIRSTPNLTYQVLTKRPELMRERMPADWGAGYPNVWLGTSIENRRFCWRRDALVEIPAAVRFISAEPLLEDISPALRLEHIEWLIVGGESGPGFRPMDHAWARGLRDRCASEGIAFFFKQSAAARTEMGTELDGRTHHEFPTTICPEAPRVLRFEASCPPLPSRPAS